MDRSFVDLSDEQWARINEWIGQIAREVYNGESAQISGISLVLHTTPIGRMVELVVDGNSTMIEDVL